MGLNSDAACRLCGFQWQGVAAGVHLRAFALQLRGCGQVGLHRIRIKCDPIVASCWVWLGVWLSSEAFH